MEASAVHQGFKNHALPAKLNIMGRLDTPPRHALCTGCLICLWAGMMPSRAEYASTSVIACGEAASRPQPPQVNICFLFAGWDTGITYGEWDALILPS